MYAKIEAGYERQDGSFHHSARVCGTIGGFMDVASRHGFPQPNYIGDTSDDDSLTLQTAMCDALDFLRYKGVYVVIGHKFLAIFKKLNRKPAHHTDTSADKSPEQLIKMYNSKRDVTDKPADVADVYKFNWGATPEVDNGLSN